MMHLLPYSFWGQGWAQSTNLFRVETVEAGDAECTGTLDI